MDENENTPSNLPEDLTTLDTAGLDAAEDAAREEAAAIRETPEDDLSDAQIERLSAIADYIDSVDARRGEMETEAAERRERAQAALARLDGPEDGGDGDDEDGEGDPAGEDPAGDAAPADAPVETPDAGTAPEPVAAGGARGVRSMRQPRRARPTTPSRAPLSIVASASAHGNVQRGDTLDGFAGAAVAFEARSQGFPLHDSRPAKGLYMKEPVAQIRRPMPEGGLHFRNPEYGDDFQSLAAAAAVETRLSGGSLVAAGGWCAPSDIAYGIPEDETLDGIVNLPTVTVDRGGLKYTPGPDFSTIYSAAGFAQTEAQAIAGTTKTCGEVACPDFVEVRLDAVGICIKAPLLTRRAYPEAIQRWIGGTVVANQHKVAARLLTAMATALGTALVPTLTGTPITWSTLTALELIGESERDKYRLSRSQTMEVIAPHWLRTAVRADLANRFGVDDPEMVTDAAIDRHFAVRGMAVQWVLNWQMLTAGAVAFPGTVQVMMYPAGTFVRGQAEVISLDTVYDTADLQTNVYTAAFVEDGVLLAKMKNGGRLITLPVHVTGQKGANDLDQTWGTAQVNADG